MLLKTFFKGFALLVILVTIFCVVTGLIFYQKISSELPDTKQLSDVHYQTPLNVFSNKGKLIAQFGEKRRIPVTYEQIPEQLINAFVAAEDYRFFEHPGVDYQGLLRAAIQLALTGKKKQGGSTITMQVVRNFLLSPEKTYIRKLKEIILAFKIERELSKQQILELYLNKIYLGHRAYGVAAAAKIYYGKTLSDLDLAQQAMIAGLPKAPSQTNPISNEKKALDRRNYVLRRMYELDYIAEPVYQQTLNAPISARLHHQEKYVSAPYIAEMVRNEMFTRYGEDAYTSGLKVYTTVADELQQAANQALANTLHAYDRRHGYRLKHKISNKTFADLTSYNTIGDTYPAWVEAVEEKSVTARLKDQSQITLTWDNIKWAKPFKNRNYTGPNIKTATSIISPGDIIRVRLLPDGSWELSQIPEVEGALVALNPNDGAILALSGGFDFFQSKYNRVLQSKRQPGSGFKPIIYTTALENGFTAASLINDAPVVIDDPSRETEWRPENYSHKFFGPTRLRTGLRKSRNLISIRLLRQLGIEKVTASAQRFGFQKDQIPHSLSLALGSGHASPLQMARMYAVFANGGFLITPYFIQRIENASGEIIYQANPKIACRQCDDLLITNQNYAERIISPQINFLMNSLLRDVVQRGTATRAKSLGRKDLAGKTGTTNDQRDAWFNGFSPNIVSTVWVGFDNPKPLGTKETGGKAALPMWVEFMKTALTFAPEEMELIAPDGIVRTFIDPESGLLLDSHNANGIWEYFRIEYQPRDYAQLTESPEVLFEQHTESGEELF